MVPFASVKLSNFVMEVLPMVIIMGLQDTGQVSSSFIDRCSTNKATSFSRDSFRQILFLTAQVTAHCLRLHLPVIGRVPWHGAAKELHLGRVEVVPEASVHVLVFAGPGAVFAPLLEQPEVGVGKVHLLALADEHLDNKPLKYIFLLCRRAYTSVFMKVLGS